MNILLLGSGGREHTLAWKIKQSSLLNKLFITPGNAGTFQEGTNVSMDISNFESVGNFCLSNNIEMLVVGPEEPLVKGICDYFISNEKLKHIALIGPTKMGAQLEGSKDFSKQFMEKYNIPTARYKSFTRDTVADGFHFLKSLRAPYVLKADGLAAGKGVIILDNITEAQIALADMVEGKFGDASKTVVIEEYLHGIEMSAFVVTDGKSYKILPSAKDYKRIGDGDKGLNTGGMGAVSPVPFADKIFMKKLEDTVIRPTVKGLLNEGIHYCGFIFFGIMNVKGDPFVIEYNVRMGDPETEVVVPRIKNDLVEIFVAMAKGKLDEINFEIDERTVTTVMMVSEGYPEAYEKGKEILGLESVEKCIPFHAGTKFHDGKIVTNGGRVIAVSAFGNSIQEARNLSYKGVDEINFEGKYFRKDIGLDLMNL